MKKLISILLLVAMLVLSLAACGGSKKKTTAPTTTAPQSTPAVTTPSQSTTTPPPAVSDPWEEISAEVKAMSADKRNIIIHMSNDSQQSVKNKEYVEGPASRDNATTIQGFVYDRNHEAYEKLGMTVTYVYSAWSWSSAHIEIVNACKATQTANSPDMYVNVMYSMVGAALSGVFREITTIPGSYLNFESQGWFTEIMSDVSFDRERLYLIASDYYLDILRNMMGMPFNLTLIDTSTNNKELVAAITGQEVFEDRDEFGNPQFLSQALFELVWNGEWTYDKLTEIVSAIHSDSDNIAGDSEDDQPMGVYMEGMGGTLGSGMLYSTDTPCVIEGTDENGKLTLTYPTTGDAFNAIFQASEKLMKANGSVIVQGADHIETNKKMRAKFTAGDGFAIMAECLANFESTEYQAMEQVFSVLPLPLLEKGEVDDHNTPIHNCAALGAINIRSAKYLAITAFIQYVTEHELTQDIRNEYLHILMKYDLLEYNEGTIEMLDIIYAHVKSCREMIIDNIVYQQDTGENKVDMRWHGLLRSYRFETGDFLAQYESYRGAKQAALNELLALWRTLPTQDAPAPDPAPAE